MVFIIFSGDVILFVINKIVYKMLIFDKEYRNKV